MMFRRFGLAGLLGALAWLTSCSSDEGLETLRQDPISAVLLDGGELVDVVEKGSGSSLGQPTAAVLRRSFAPSGGAELDVLLANAVTASMNEGWELTEENPDRFYRGTKVIDGHNIELSVYRSEGLSGDEVVILNLQLAR